MSKTTAKKVAKTARSTKTAAGKRGVTPTPAAALPVQTPHIGAYVLETLTLGMYGEPRHTIREYVQNAYDSIRAAKRVKGIAVTGRVDVNLGNDEITIRDDGQGVAAAQAWSTLTSIGASKKDRQRDAGFRGIGRLAGMAYCDKLTFRTTFFQETELSTVTFDCKALMKAISPDDGGSSELTKLLASATKFEQVANGAKAGDHFFEVILSGLTNAPSTLTEPDAVRDYLSMTAPVDFDPKWGRAESIRKDYLSQIGNRLETIQLFVKSSAQAPPVQVFKPYGESYPYAKGTTKLLEVTHHLGDEGRYWAWIGKLDRTAAVTDERTRGLRVRVRNIQVDGTEILEGIFASVNASYGRISAYFVGEIHVDPRFVVPNARRDGFEETDQWLEIKADIRERICRPFGLLAYKESGNKQTDITKLISSIDALAKSSAKLAATSKATYDQVVKVMVEAKRFRQRANSALGVIDELGDGVDAKAKKVRQELRDATKQLDDVESRSRMLIGSMVESDGEGINSLKSRIREQVLEEVLEVVKPHVDSITYAKIKKQLHAQS